MASVAELDALFGSLISPPSVLATYQPPSDEQIEQSHVLQAREQVEQTGGDRPERREVSVADLDRMFATMGVPMEEHTSDREDTWTTEKGVEYSPFDIPVAEARRLRAPRALAAPAPKPEILQPTQESLRRQPLQSERAELREMDILLPEVKKAPVVEEPRPAGAHLEDMGFTFKEGPGGVFGDSRAVDERMNRAASAVKDVFEAHNLPIPMITSAKRESKRFSFHDIGLALDFRVNDLQYDQRKALYNTLMAELPEGYEVAGWEILPEDYGLAAGANMHLHIEADTGAGGGTKDELILHALKKGKSIPKKWLSRAVQLQRELEK